MYMNERMGYSDGTEVDESWDKHQASGLEVEEMGIGLAFAEPIG